MNMVILASIILVILLIIYAVYYYNNYDKSTFISSQCGYLQNNQQPEYKKFLMDYMNIKSGNGDKNVLAKTFTAGQYPDKSTSTQIGKLRVMSQPASVLECPGYSKIKIVSAYWVIAFNAEPMNLNGIDLASQMGAINVTAKIAEKLNGKSFFDIFTSGMPYGTVRTSMDIANYFGLDTLCSPQYPYSLIGIYICDNNYPPVQQNYEA